MSFQHRDNSGSLFVNDRKSEAKHADWRGSCKIGNAEYWIDAFSKEGQRGPWLSLTFRQKDAS